MQVIIPAMDRPWIVRLSLRSLLLQGLRQDEIHIVVDSDPINFYRVHSEFPDVDIIGAPRAPGDDKRHLAAVRNIGAMRAVAAGETERFLFIDGDVIPSNAVVAAHRALGDSPVIGCGVRQRVAAALVAPYKDIPNPDPAVFSLKNIPDQRFASDTEYRRSRLPQILQMCEQPMAFPKFCHGFQVSYPAGPFMQTGGFWTQLEFRQDQEFAARLCRLGCLALMLPKAHSVHVEHPASNLRRAEANALFEWAMANLTEIRP